MKADDWRTVIEATKTNVLRTESESRELREAGRAAANRLGYEFVEDAIEARNAATARRLNAAL